MEPIVVEATRGAVIEARHRVHAVAVRDGGIVYEAGDPALVTYFRSSAKPIQALPVVRARPDLEDAEIAMAGGEHLGDGVAGIEPRISALLGTFLASSLAPFTFPASRGCRATRAGSSAPNAPFTFAASDP